MNKKQNIFLFEEVNFIISVIFLGSAALLGTVLIFEADETLDNPIQDLIAAAIIEYQDYGPGGRMTAL